MNHRITLARRPTGTPDDDTYATDDVPVPELDDGQALVEVTWLSMDPTIRGWMAYDTYLPAIGIGEPIRSAGVGTIVESRNSRYPVGASVFGTVGWQQYAIAESGYRVLPEWMSPEQALGVYGITSVTAYVGLFDIGRVEPGETVLVSGAAGATGSVAGQIARIKGCRVVGIAGSDEKCAWITDELGFDAAINYKTEDVRRTIRRHCPSGVDVYFDNVGGDILEAAIANIAQRGRIVLCGAISSYNDAAPRPGPSNLPILISQRGRMEGFIIMDHMSRVMDAVTDLRRWNEEGEIVFRTDVVEGLDQAPTAFERLFTGANTGKVLVKL